MITVFQLVHYSQYEGEERDAAFLTIEQAEAYKAASLGPTPDWFDIEEVKIFVTAEQALALKYDGKSSPYYPPRQIGSFKKFDETHP